MAVPLLPQLRRAASSLPPLLRRARRGAGSAGRAAGAVGPAAVPSLRRAAVPLSLATLAYVLALVQRPGEVIADTRLGLHVAPDRFLSTARDAWSPTADLGHVFSGQVSAFPMATWFSLGDALGLSPWLVHRLWLGTLLAVAAVGMVALLRALVNPVIGVAHVTAGVLYIVCPYVAVVTNRTSVVLLAYAVLPWLLLAVHRGLREPSSWRWPAGAALLLAAAGGAVNAGSLVWLLLAVLLLVAYELTWGGVDGGALGGWLLRLIPCALLVNAWWIVPLVVQARYGEEVLAFAGQPGTDWSGASLSESLRGMGASLSYAPTGFDGALRPVTTHGAVLLTDLKVVLASLIVPALVLLGLWWTRHARYAPWFLLLVLTGLLVMGAGWADGAPLSTDYEAGPLAMLGLAALGGLAAAAVWERLGEQRPGGGPSPGRIAAVVAGVALIALAAWPLTRGTAPDGQLAIEVPARWKALAASLDKRPDDRRALVLPGQLQASYTWGQTLDPVLPSLTDHLVTTRNVQTRADRRSAELQWAVDDLVSQERVLPGQLPSLLDLLGVGDVVIAADGDRARSGELGAAETAQTLSTELALRGGRSFGGKVSAQPAGGRIAPARIVPALRDVRVPTGGLVRVMPRGPLTLVDGGARAFTALAAFDELDPGRAYSAGADLTTDAARGAARAGGGVVIADGVRRQALVASRLRGGVGPVLPANRGVGQDGVRLDPYADTGVGTDAQTVQVLRGIADVRAPFSPQITQFPEHRPFAALDGDLGTAWLADRRLGPERAVLTVDLGRELDVPRLQLYPASDSRGVVTAVRVNGKRFTVRRGWNTLAVKLEDVRELQVAIDSVRSPRRASAGSGGVRELRIPGVSAGEALRVPDLLQQRLRGEDLSSSTVTYLLERFTASSPQRYARLAGPPQAALLQDARDPEQRLDRVIHPPVARSFALNAWTRVDVDADDSRLDRLTGVRGDLRADSSSRFDGLPRWRASGAFDGSAGARGRAWIGQWIPGQAAWISWRTAKPLTMRRLRLLEVTGVRVRRPTRVRLTVDGRAGPPVAVGLRGFVDLPLPVTGRQFRLDVLEARFAEGTPAAVRTRRAVGIAELRAAGLPRLRVPRRGRVAMPCGSASILVRRWAAGPLAKAGERAVRVRLRADVDLRALDAGRALRAEGCGQVELPSAELEIQGARGALVIDRLRLEAAPPSGLSVIPGPGGRVIDPGRRDGSGRSGVSVQAAGPSWLVFGQSYNRGWRAQCDGRDLGAPVPLQGYANGWPLGAPGCEDLTLRFGPEGSVDTAAVVSAIGAVGLLGVMLVPLGLGGAGRRPEPAAPAPLPDPDERLDAMPLRRALGWGAAITVLVGVAFALRAGLVLGPLAALILWRGLPTRLLFLLAGGLLLVLVPSLYLVQVLLDGRGNPFDISYASDRAAVHWVAVTAFVLLAIGLARTLAAALPDSHPLRPRSPSHGTGGIPVEPSRPILSPSRLRRRGR